MNEIRVDLPAMESASDMIYRIYAIGPVIALLSFKFVLVQFLKCSIFGTPIVCSYRNPWPTSRNISLGCRMLCCFWFWWYCMSLYLLLYNSNFFCSWDILWALFWFFFSKTAFILCSCCLSALAASFKYSLTFESRAVCSFLMDSFVQAILVVIRL